MLTNESDRPNPSMVAPARVHRPIQLDGRPLSNYRTADNGSSEAVTRCFELP